MSNPLPLNLSTWFVHSPLCELDFKSPFVPVLWTHPVFQNTYGVSAIMFLKSLLNCTACILKWYLNSPSENICNRGDSKISNKILKWFSERLLPKMAKKNHLLLAKQNNLKYLRTNIYIKCQYAEVKHGNFDMSFYL